MKKILTTPIKAEDLQDIRVGDVIYLTGTLVTCRDVCHRRLIELKRPIPYDLNGKAIFHAGPIVRKKRRQMGDGLRRPDNQYAYGKF
ncbi:L-tartrate dehydratase subunit beta [Escherichia coli]|nr:L-tartrate dehydratase subunit beta [Escherichia coli]